MSKNEMDTLAARLAVVEERLARLEAGVPLQPAPKHVDHIETPAPSIDAALIGKSILIIGGGYVLRALTEMGVLAEAAGIALGLTYALFWVFVADRALKRGRTIVALFDAATAALIAASLIWEATTRLHLLTPAIASSLIVAVSLAMLMVARHHRSAPIALIAVILGCLTCIGVAIGTAHLVEPLFALSIIGFVVSIFDWPLHIFSIVAAASDALALPLIAMTLMAQGHENIPAEMALIAFAVAWLIIPRPAQAVIATALGLGGAAAIAQFHDGDVIGVAIVCIVISAACWFAAFRRSRDDVFAICAAIAAFAGTILVLQPTPLAGVWAVASLASAFAARRWSWDWMNVHAACWALAAALAAGLPSAFIGAKDPSPIVVIVALLAAVALWAASEQAHRSRFTLLTIVAAASIAVTVGGLSDLMTSRAILAMTRTVVLSVAAVVLTGLSSSVPEAKNLSRILLVVCGAKLLLEDLRAGNGVTITVALALYGGAILIVARNRGRTIPQQS